MSNLLNRVSAFANDNKAILGVGVGSAVLGGGVATLAMSARSRSKSRKRKRKSTSRKKSYRKSRRRQKQPYTARKRKDTSHRRIRYTKNNQPYVILASGKARFIKKKSVSRSRKRKGGRY